MSRALRLGRIRGAECCGWDRLGRPSAAAIEQTINNKTGLYIFLKNLLFWKSVFAPGPELKYRVNFFLAKLGKVKDLQREKNVWYGG